MTSEELVSTRENLLGPSGSPQRSQGTWHIVAQEVAESAAISTVAGMVLPTASCTSNPIRDLHQCCHLGKNPAFMYNYILYVLVNLREGKVASVDGVSLTS
jgi:hypothetical protein